MGVLVKYCVLVLLLGGGYHVPLMITQAGNIPTVSPQHLAKEHKVGALPIVLKSWERIDKMKDRMEVDMKKSGTDFKRDKYDFIVVGAGTSGSIVASQLSQQFSVLLLEAGGQPHPSHDNPSMSMIMGKHLENDWMYKSVEQSETCLLCPDKKYIFSAGKGLGGSANLNYLDTLYQGEFEDYTDWMEKTMDPGWGLFMLQTYFRSVKEHMTKNYVTSGTDSAFYRSTYKALVKPHASLEVQKYSRVNKVIIDDNGRALGVEYERYYGAKNQVFATKEVILSAGTFGSPKLLMLSGIGPHDLLNDTGIPVKADLPVGKNFQDHLAIPLGPFFKIGNETTTNFSKSSTKDSMNSTLALRMPLINLNYNIHTKEMSHFFGIPQDVFKTYMEASEKIASSKGDSMFINVALKKPLSRGYVSISGKDPKLKPVINPNFFDNVHDPNGQTHSSDKQRLIDALEETVRLMEANKKWPGKFTKAPFPGCENYVFRGYGYWDCYIRHASMSFNHGAGTCAMGSKTSRKAVVDSNLKVLGIKALRVIDASVMPSLIGTYPFHTVAVIGAKGADMIIKEYQSGGSVDVDNQLEANEREERSYSEQENRQPFGGFNIERLTTRLFGPTQKPFTFSFSNMLQSAGQIIQAYTHAVGSTLSDLDLMPPDEPASDKPNPSYFPVKPLAGRLIFHPLIPEASSNIFRFSWLNGTRFG